MATVEQLSPRASARLCGRDPVDPARTWASRCSLDGDTVMSNGSAEAAARAAGGAFMAVDAVMEGWARSAFAAVRPPGHHAEPKRPMGFCLFNNAAVAAMHARAPLGRAAGRGGGFRRASRQRHAGDVRGRSGAVLRVLASEPVLSGDGEARERGVADNIVNAPLKPRRRRRGIPGGVVQIILPALDTFAPGLLIVSAGFDAHVADPLAQLRLETADYGWITDQLIAVAEKHCGGRVVSVMEGGYDLNALSASAPCMCGG